MFEEKRYLVKATVIVNYDGTPQEEDIDFYISLTDEEVKNLHMRNYWVERAASEHYGSEFQGVKEYTLEEVKKE